MLLLILGLVVAFNFCIIIAKVQRGVWLNAILDVLIFGAIVVIFIGSFSALMVGAIASFMVSMFLWIWRPDFRHWMFWKKKKKEPKVEYHFYWKNNTSGKLVKKFCLWVWQKMPFGVVRMEV